MKEGEFIVVGFFTVFQGLIFPWAEISSQASFYLHIYCEMLLDWLPCINPKKIPWKDLLLSLWKGELEGLSKLIWDSWAWFLRDVCGNFVGIYVIKFFEGEFCVTFYWQGYLPSGLYFWHFSVNVSWTKSLSIL